MWGSMRVTSHPVNFPFAAPAHFSPPFFCFSHCSDATHAEYNRGALQPFQPYSCSNEYGPDQWVEGISHTYIHSRSGGEDGAARPSSAARQGRPLSAARQDRPLSLVVRGGADDLLPKRPLSAGMRPSSAGSRPTASDGRGRSELGCSSRLREMEVFENEKGANSYDPVCIRILSSRKGAKKSIRFQMSECLD